jgi:hypothetical protein
MAIFYIVCFGILNLSWIVRNKFKVLQ